VSAQELAIVGYTPSTHSSAEIGALLLGVMEDGAMVYAGKVGTRYTAKMRTELMQTLERNRQPKPAVGNSPRVKDATWVTPRLVAQVQFIEWTSDGRLRHPSFLGLRSDKSPEEYVREKSKSETPRAEEAKEKGRSAKRAAAQKNQKAPDIAITHPEKVIYPRDGITKKDIAEYFEAVSEPMLRAIAGRPLALEHWNEGIEGPSWFHQNIGRDAQPWMHLAETPAGTGSGSVKHLVADSPQSLRWLAQRSALTVHMWSSREGSLEAPDWIVFDLDPAKGKGRSEERARA
jgi:Predicted eukaryotic-type DNA primase